MLVAGLAATIALVGASHGALLDQAYCGQAPSWPLWSMRGSLSQTAAEATLRMRGSG
jgi:hypothetical protein